MSTARGATARGSLRSSDLVSKRSPSNRARTGTTSTVPAGSSGPDALPARRGALSPLGCSTTASAESTEILTGTQDDLTNTVHWKVALIHINAAPNARVMKAISLPPGDRKPAQLHYRRTYVSHSSQETGVHHHQGTGVRRRGATRRRGFGLQPVRRRRVGCARSRYRQPDLSGAVRCDQLIERPGAYRAVGTHLARTRRLQQGGLARGAQRSPPHSRRERDGLPDRHAAAGRLSGGRALAAGVLDRGFRDRPHVTAALLVYRQAVAELTW